MQFHRLIASCLATVFLAANLSADDGETTVPETTIRWTFDDKFAETLVGNAKIRPIGPTGKFFDGMPDRNSALVLTGKGDFVRIADTEDGRYDFGNGDAITIESWVRCDRIKSGQNIYIVGKGRTHLSSDKDNQNYALRLRGVGKKAHASFLFRSAATEEESSQWHRWTSKIGFRPDGVWHHVAVSYQFGKPQTARGYIDGEPTTGTWDMGGATKRPPIVDDDELWIGSSMGGNPGNSLTGAIDELAIHRRVMGKDHFANRRVVIERAPSFSADQLQPGKITVMLHEDVGKHTAWPMQLDQPYHSYTQDTFGFSQIPAPYGRDGVRRDWRGTLMLTATALVDLPKGQTEWMLRAGGLSRLWIDETVVVRTPPHLSKTDGHGEVIDERPSDPWLRPRRPGHHEEVFAHSNKDSGYVRLTLQTMIGGDDLRPEIGELLLAFRHDENEPWRVLSLDAPFELTDHLWRRYQDEHETKVLRINDRLRRRAAIAEDEYWNDRHSHAKEYAESLPKLDHDSIDAFVDTKLAASNVAAEGPLDDDTFLRRLFLDCTGVVPTVAEIESYKAMKGGREEWVRRATDDPRWADHWTVYWMDVLAENPNILKATLNNTGPFRWYLYDMMRDNVSVDRWVTNLIRMEGSEKYGGPAGFGIATQNDVPMAAKAHVLGSAFLGINMKCARCHDAPYHDWTQKDLFSIAAMLAGESIDVPETSSVPKEFFGDESEEESLISVTLKPGEKVKPNWPLAEPKDQPATHDNSKSSDSREHLAFRITRPENERFAETIVNRIWGRLLGEAIVEPIDDWEGASPSHPGLLSYLARELITHDYDVKHVTRLILQSDAYGRTAADRDIVRDEDKRFFASPRVRRMSAEQLVDSLHVVVGSPIDSDELTFDPEARMKPTAMINLGAPRRAWQFTSLSNERDRPALSLPRAGAVCECLEAFGWKGTRQEPINHRDEEANVLQPAILASGLLSLQLTRLTDRSELTSVCVDVSSPEQLVRYLFQRFLGRRPTKPEHKRFVSLLAEGFDSRVLRTPALPETPLREPPISWANHLNAEATLVRNREMERLRNGPPPTGRLSTEWRERAEDAVWALINTPEFQFTP